MVANSEALRNLTALGLSEYEARAYVSLLQESPVTAYETAKNAGIPAPKIYGVMSKLLEREMAIELQEDGKKMYAPLRSGEFISTYRQRMESTLDTLEKELGNLGSRDELSYIWNISGYDAFLERARMIIGGAERTALLSVWPEEFDALQGLIGERAAAGVKTAVVYFGEPAPAASDGPVGRGRMAEARGAGGQKGPVQFFTHPIADTLYQEKGGRGFAAVADGVAALMGTIRDDSVEGAWSGNQGFVTLAEDYIKHDIYIMKIVRRFDGELIRRFGPGYRRLRDIFSDTEEEEKDGGSVYRRRVVR